MRLPEKLNFVQSVQNPTSKDISFFISVLEDPDENELLQTAVLMALKRCGDAAVPSLISSLSLLYSEKSQNPKSLVRISYALSQIQKTPPSVLIEFLSNNHPRVRQNGVIGLSLQNDGEFDLLLFSVLQNDPDPTTAYDAAEALGNGGNRTLYLFKTVILRDLKQNPYIDSEKKLEAIQKIRCRDAVSIKTEESLPALSGRLTDAHVLWKILEILGNTQNPELLPYIEPYLFHENPKIKNLAEMLIQKFEK